MNRLNLSILVFLVFWAIACQSDKNLDQPPQIRYGEDPCDECYMIINEQRFAAAFYTVDGQTHRFDDMGCMFVYLNKHRMEVDRFWVVDFSTLKWIRGEVAYVVKSGGLETPMGYGLVAFQDSIAAYQFASKKGGKVFRFSEVKNWKEIPK